MGNEGKEATKACKHCMTEIPKGAKICPQCRRKQGGILKWALIAFVVIGIIGAAAGGGGDKKTDSGTQTAGKQAEEGKEKDSGAKEDVKETEPTEAPVTYVSVTADELSDALSKNAMRAQKDYKDQYLKIKGKLGTIDSSGDYICIKSNKDFDLTNIQCFLKTDEQKEVVMDKSEGDEIVVKGLCKDVGELMGYSVDIDSVK